MAITKTRRGRPSPEMSRQKLAEILAAGREEFGRRGYRGVTMRGVADKASVSTRTLYNYFKDKLSLFAACLDVGAVAFPHIPAQPVRDVASVLRRFATEFVETLSSDMSMRMGVLVYREGADFPELVAAAEANQDRFLVTPLAAFLAANGLGGADARETARLFNTLAAAEWQRSAVFGHAMPTRSEIERHAAMIVAVFLSGVASARDGVGEQTKETDMKQDRPAGADARFGQRDGVNRVWRIARPITGIPGTDDFRMTEEPLPQPADGQVLMRTIYISIAPGIRPMLPYAGAEPDVAQDGSAGRAEADERLPDPSRVRVGERMRSGIVPSASPYAGGTVGRVVASRHPGYAPGDYIFGGRHWQDFEVLDGDASLRLDPAWLPIEADLTLTGRSAFTGWVGYRRYCNARRGETIIVSSAAGAVGMLVVQMAKADGLRVIGITSGADKCRFVTGELGADACIDRLAGDVGAALDQHAPQGADIYFDNVGGNLMLPVAQRLKPFGRLIVCGMAAEYNGAEQSVVPTGSILAKRLHIQGFVVLDHEEDYGPFRDDVAALWRAGKLVYKQDVFEGLDRAPDALAACLSGSNAGGKILVQVSQDDSREGAG